MVNGHLSHICGQKSWQEDSSQGSRLERIKTCSGVSHSMGSQQKFWLNKVTDFKILLYTVQSPLNQYDLIDLMMNLSQYKYILHFPISIQQRLSVLYVFFHRIPTNIKKTYSMFSSFVPVDLDVVFWWESTRSRVGSRKITNINIHQLFHLHCWETTK